MGPHICCWLLRCDRPATRNPLHNLWGWIQVSTADDGREGHDTSCILQSMLYFGTKEENRRGISFLMHGGCPPASITQSGLTTGKSVHGEPKSKARRSIYNK